MWVGRASHWYKLADFMQSAQTAGAAAAAAATPSVLSVRLSADELIELSVRESVSSAGRVRELALESQFWARFMVHGSSSQHTAVPTLHKTFCPC